MDARLEAVSDEMGKAGRKRLGLGSAFVSKNDGFCGWLLADRPTFFNGYKPASWHFESDENEYDDDDDEEEEEEGGGGVDDDGDGVIEMEIHDGDAALAAVAVVPLSSHRRPKPPP